MGSIRSYFKCLKWRSLIIAFSAILIGLLFILTPQTSADVICYVAGILLLASGIAAVVSYLASGRLFGSYALVSGIVLLVCGVFCLLPPEVIQGLTTVITRIRATSSRYGRTAAAGVFGLTQTAGFLPQARMRRMASRVFSGVSASTWTVTISAPASQKRST